MTKAVDYQVDALYIQLRIGDITMPLIRTIPVKAFRKLARLAYNHFLREFLASPLSESLCTLMEAHPARGPILGPAEAAAMISTFISTGRPFLVGRFGATEMKLLINFYFSKLERRKVGEFLDWALYGNKYGITDEMMAEARTCSGIFPPDRSEFHQFCRIYANAALQVDLLASWVKGENIFVDRARAVMSTSLPNIEPYFHEIPWSQALEGRKVLVVHPYAESIHFQYHNHRHKLFPNAKLLPEFELVTYKSIQSLGGQESGHQSWSNALETMKADIRKIEFDTAIIGCGAYGLPLAAEIKTNLNKQAIHLGGATQILFGIRGLRWDRMPNVSRFYNDYWKRPFPSEIPQANVLFEKVEGSGYW